MTQRQPALYDPEPGWNDAIRTPRLRANPRAMLTSAATRCECGGFLAECDDGRVFCLRCESDPCAEGGDNAD